MKGIRRFWRSTTNPKINSVDDSDDDEEITEEVYGFTALPELKNDVVYVALGIDDVANALTILACAVAYCKANKMKLGIIHVYRPAVKIPIQLGCKFEGIAGEDAIMKYCEYERLRTIKKLGMYVRKCNAEGLQAERIWIENRSFKRGLMDLIIQHGIKWLVMGAGSSRNTLGKSAPVSGKARFALEDAPSFVHIWFISNESLVCTRRSKSMDQK